MDHAVHYRTSAGDTKLEEVGSLEAAVSLVERLRNDEGVSDVRVYKQVPIEFRAYYKVTVVGEDAGSNGQAVSATPAPAPAPAAQPAAPAPSVGRQDPPPGAMPLGPSTPSAQPAAQPSAQPSGQAAPQHQDQGDEGEGNRRGSLFSRG